MAELVGKKDCWVALKITERTLDRWKLEAGFPDCSDGYDVEEVRDWAKANGKKGFVESDNPDLIVTRSIRFEKRKEMLLKNKRLELEIARLESELLPRSIFHDLLMECATLINGVAAQQRRMGNPTAAEMIDEQMDRMRKLVHDRLADAAKSNSK